MLLMHGVVAFALAFSVQSDSAEVARVVDAFHSALTAGDSIAAFSLLAEDALILESGGLETLEEYRSHHLQGDIAFAQAVTRERRRVRVEVRGDVAWAVSTSITTGEFRSRQINSQDRADGSRSNRSRRLADQRDSLVIESPERPGRLKPYSKSTAGNEFDTR